MGHSVGGTVLEECFQGGVIYPLLWCLLVDGLLRELNRTEIKVVENADNIVILVKGPFDEILALKITLCKTYHGRLDRMQARFLRGNTAVRRNTPNVVIWAVLGLPSLAECIKEEATKTAFKLS